MVPARISLVTLGTLDMTVMRDFYRSLGWREASGSDEHAMFDTGGAILMLYPSSNLADDAQVSHAERAGFPNFTLAINLGSRDAVDDAFAELRKLDVNVTKSPEEVFWGGYSGYFSDPEGNLWEIAWNPYARLDERGAMTLTE